MSRRPHTGPLHLEHREAPLLPPGRFVVRLLRFFALAVAVILITLGLGVLGYHFLGKLRWLDALVNASMILGGMGPVDPIATTSGKWFASFYALFSGVVFLGAVGVLFAPILHRFLHHYHLDLEDQLRERKK